MSPLLTIAVPTYNRVEKLSVCLDRIAAQVQGKPVEVLVSDNHSDDTTEAFMNDYMRDHQDITYIRNAENIGPDRNFLNCFERAAGEYVLLLGDDDVLLPGALDRILDALSTKPVFVRLNTSGLKTVDPLSYTDPCEPEGEDRSYDSRDVFLKDMGIYITFISAMVMRTDLIRQVPNKERYIGTYFIQSHIALNTLTADGEYVFVTKNCIAASGNVTVNYDLYHVWGEQYYNLLWQTGIACGFRPETIRQIHRNDMATMIYGFIRNFRQTCSNESQWNKGCIMRSVRNYPGLYPRYLAAVYLPNSWLNALSAAKNRLKK